MLVRADLRVGKALMQIMEDEQELAMFLPFTRGSVTLDDRRAYAAWLRARGDDRAELLEIALALDQGPDDPAARARLGELLARPGAPRGWWSLVRAALALANCGQGLGQPATVRFAFACPMSWEELAPTEDATERHCARCDQRVYRCTSLRAAEDHARLGHCIAVPIQLTTERCHVRSGFLGQPEHPLLTWARDLFGPLPEE